MVKFSTIILTNSRGKFIVIFILLSVSVVIVSSGFAGGGNILTERERKILQLVVEGLTNQEISKKLCISTSTVDTHRKNIMAKLDIHSIAGLVKYAIRHKIVTL